MYVSKQDILTLEEMQSSKVYFWNVTFQRYYGTKSMK